MADPKKKDAPAPPAETASENKPAQVASAAEADADLLALRKLAERAESAEEALADARDQISQLHADAAAMRADFKASWDEREAEIKALLAARDALPEGAPVRGRMVRFARHTIHCSDDKGQPLTIRHGHTIPAGAKLDGVGADAIGEREGD